jgi:nitrate reductase gamma subunit
MVVPITFLDIYKSMQELGVPKGTAAGLLAVFGMGVMTYDRKRKKKLKYRP